MKTFQKFNGSKRGKKGERSESILMVSSCRVGRTGQTEHQTVSVPQVRDIVGFIHLVEDDHLRRGKKKNEYQLKPARLRERKQKKQEKE